MNQLAKSIQNEPGDRPGLSEYQRQEAIARRAAVSPRHWRTARRRQPWSENCGKRQGCELLHAPLLLMGL